MFLYILYFILFSGVGDIFFSLYNLSLILISLINSFVIHGFLFLYLIFVFSNGKLKLKYCCIVSIKIVNNWDIGFI